MNEPSQKSARTLRLDEDLQRKQDPIAKALRCLVAEIYNDARHDDVRYEGNYEAEIQEVAKAIAQLVSE